MKQIKQYSSYDEYISHQLSKTSNPKIRSRLKSKHDKRVKIFIEHLKNLPVKEGKVIATASRLGEEVEAFNKLGYSAVGIDLYASPPLVLAGDFHDIKMFQDGSFDIYYTNSFDHSLYPEKLISEAVRLLKLNGILVIEIHPGMDGQYEVISVDDSIRKMVPLKLLSVNIIKGMYRVKEHQYIWQKEVQ